MKISGLSSTLIIIIHSYSSSEEQEISQHCRHMKMHAGTVYISRKTDEVLKIVCAFDFKAESR